MKLKEIVQALDELAPGVYQESYDNSGLLVGEVDMEITGALICLDSIEDVLDEAIELGVNLIIAHHPIVFGGLKRFTGKTYVERVIMKAIRNNLAIVAVHTNLDNVYHGVNQRIAAKLGLENTKVLSPKRDVLKKLVVFCPADHSQSVRQAMFNTGAGEIGNYSSCSFNSTGEGTFLPGEETDPHVGEHGKLHTESEEKIEVILEGQKVSRVVDAMIAAHPYEEVAYDIYPLENEHSLVGSGLVGNLPAPLDLNQFLGDLAKTFNCDCLRHTQPLGKKIERVALCGGSGSFLLKEAMASGAQIFITADFKYHQFFDAEGKIVIVDMGHYESEQFTIELLGDFLREKFPNFALHLTKINTNPVKYFLV